MVTRIHFLNPVENLWVIFSHDVFADFKQFDTLDELKDAILYECERISTKSLFKLSDSMVWRCTLYTLCVVVLLSIKPSFVVLLCEYDDILC